MKLTKRIVNITIGIITFPVKVKDRFVDMIDNLSEGFVDLFDSIGCIEDDDEWLEEIRRKHEEDDRRRSIDVAATIIKQTYCAADIGRIYFNDVCPISCEPFEPGEPISRLPCGHVFSNDSIVYWLMKKNCCPVCRKSSFDTTNCTDSADPTVPTESSYPRIDERVLS